MVSAPVAVLAVNLPVKSLGVALAVMLAIVPLSLGATVGVTRVLPPAQQAENRVSYFVGLYSGGD